MLTKLKIPLVLLIFLTSNAAASEICHQDLPEGLTVDACLQLSELANSSELYELAETGGCVAASGKLLEKALELGLDADKIALLSFARKPGEHGYPNMLVPAEGSTREGVSGPWVWHMSFSYEDLIFDASYLTVTEKRETYFQVMWQDFYEGCAPEDCFFYAVQPNDLADFSRPRQSPYEKPRFLNYQSLSFEEFLTTPALRSLKRP